MDKIKLNNGREIEGATIARATWAEPEKQIVVSIPDGDVIELAILFGNSENTQKIECYQSIYKDIYYGYTTVLVISQSNIGAGYEIILKGDKNAHWEREYTIPSNFIPEVIAESINKEKETTKNGPGNENDSTGSD